MIPIIFNDVVVSRKIITILGDITESTLTKFSEDLNETTNQPIIPIVINSTGGDCHAAFGIIDLINSMHKPVATIGIGRVQSAATLILCCGTPGFRYVSENTRVMFHQVYWGTKVAASFKSENITTEAKQTEIICDRIFQIMDRNCKQKKNTLKKKVLENGNIDIFLSATEAKKFGLIDHIGIPQLEINTRVEFKLVNTK